MSSMNTQYEKSINEREDSPAIRADLDAVKNPGQRVPVSWLRRLLQGVAFITALPFYFLAVAWAVGALHFDLPAPEKVRNALAGLWVIGLWSYCVSVSD